MPILRWIRRRLVSARDAFDGRLHPRRRARALARLGERSPESVLFVCLGNVCRSPYGAWVLENRAPGSIRVESAGFILPGRPPPDTAVEVARARGIDHSSHRSRTVTAELLAASDVVFVFDRFNVSQLRRTRGVRMDRVVWLGDLDPVWTGKRAIGDPWGKPHSEFHSTFERIERCVEGVTEMLSRKGSRSQTGEPLP